MKTNGVVSHFYFYCVDADLGLFFVKFCSYFPYNAKLCINGNHWAQRQATKAGLGFEPLDNAFAQADDPAMLQVICDQLGPAQILGLPHPRSLERGEFMRHGGRPKPKAAPPQYAAATCSNSRSVRSSPMLAVSRVGHRSPVGQAVKLDAGLGLDIARHLDSDSKIVSATASPSSNAKN